MNDKVMKEIRLDEKTEFELELPSGSNIRRFEIGFEEHNIQTAGSSSYIVGPGPRMMKEVSLLFVEMRVDTPLVKRKFKVVPINETLESTYKYVGSAYSPANFHWVHLFEHVCPY